MGLKLTRNKAEKNEMEIKMQESDTERNTQRKKTKTVQRDRTQILQMKRRNDIIRAKRNIEICRKNI